jgi:hypothetical protein
MSFIWHYTPAFRAKMILKSGSLMPPHNNSDAHYRQLVWLSSEQIFEPTASYSPTLTRLGLDFTVRFGLPSNDRRLIKFADAPLDAAERERLSKIGRKWGANPKKWFVVVGAIPVVEMTFETRRNQRWESEDPNTFIESVPYDALLSSSYEFSPSSEVAA